MTPVALAMKFETNLSQ